MTFSAMCLSTPDKSLMFKIKSGNWKRHKRSRILNPGMDVLIATNLNFDDVLVGVEVVSNSCSEWVLG